MSFSKYIFLDFDGPLNTGRSEYLDPERYGHHFDDLAVRNLRKIINETGAQIVVSSSWKHLGLDKLLEMWSNWGLPGQIIGCTPGGWDDSRLFNTRGEEIQQWLTENAVGEYAYVVIDDIVENEMAAGQERNWIEIDPHCGITYDDAELAIKILNRNDPVIRKRKRRTMLTVLIIVSALVLGRILWVMIATRNIGSFETEKKELLARRDFLIEKVIVSPEKLIAEMPTAVGPQFQGEWAIYSCSMLSAALVNLSILYPETADKSRACVDSLVRIVLSKEMRSYDTARWGEDAIETLDGDHGHISYLSHLAWVIEGYKRVGGGNQYDTLLEDICEAMDRRIRMSATMNVQTYPGEPVYVPDMMVAIVALKNYPLQRERYDTTVLHWLRYMQGPGTDQKTGILKNIIPADDSWIIESHIKPVGSYSALSTYYLTLIEKDYAKLQYELFRSLFLKRFPSAGFRERLNKEPGYNYYIDSGPVIFGLSPTGTAFGIGSCTYFEDWQLRKKLLRTAELAGHSVTLKGRTHYLLADIALVGEAITLAMRTAVPWDQDHDQ